MGTCDLCDLPTPEPPVAAEDVPGTFCCRGCLEVTRTLDVDPSADEVEADPRTVLDSAAGTDRDEPTEGETAYLAVSGMHCATCEAFLEARATGRDGVLAAQASYSSGLVLLTYDPERIDEGALPDVLSGTGYRASAADVDAVEDDDESTGRLLVGGFFGMMVMLWYVLFLYPAYLGVPTGSLLFDVRGSAGTYLLANVWVMATVVLGYTGYPRLRGAYVSLRAGLPNTDLLVALAAVSAYAYSTVALLAGRTEVYFDVVVALVVVVALGNRYESRIRRRAAGHLAELATARVDTARRRTPSGTEPIDVDDLQAGDAVVVRTGEHVPVDGTVRSGTAAVDESLLTGEPRPRSRAPGDSVMGGSVVVDGALVVAVDDPGLRTIDRLVAHLWAVQSGRPGVQRLADRLAAVFVPLVIVLAAIAVGWRLLAGDVPAAALLAGLSVLVVSCPCALGLATPLAVASGVREALRAGAIVTDGAVFERGADVDVVALDKTGTLTTGEMVLVAVEGGADVLARAAAVEQLSSHPIADAVAAAQEASGRPVEPADGFRRHDGRGVSGLVAGDRVLIGRRDLLEEEGHSVPDRLASRAERARLAGDLPALVGWGGKARGLLVAGDRPREGWEGVVDALADGREVVVVTGDEGASSSQFSEHPGVTEVFAGVPPEAKAALVARLRSRGTVAMVGDGTNDASALAAADVGIAIERGAALASEAADVVVTTDDLASVPTVLALTAATRRRVRFNLAWAFGYNAVAIPLALSGLLNPLLAAVAMAGSSLLVVGNSARRLLASGGALDGSDPPTRRRGTQWLPMRKRGGDVSGPPASRADDSR